MKLTGKKSAKRAVSCKFCYSKIKIRWPKVPSWVKHAVLSPTIIRKLSHF